MIIYNNNNNNNNDYIIMEYQKTMNLLDDTTNQPSRFRTRDWVEINDESKEDIIVILHSKHLLQGQIYVIVVMHTYLLWGL